MIHFFCEDIEYSLPNPDVLRTWLNGVASLENQNIDELNYIFCSDKYLHNINLEYLNHDTYTDIITFDHRDEEATPVVGDIFISLERVKDNADRLSLRFEDERDRVIVHGLLHLLGYDDKTEESKQQMRKKEDACLSLR